MLLILCRWLGAALELALPFSDHAVLQAGKPLPVWGKAIPGGTVTVKLGERSKKTTVSAEGFWQVEFEKSGASSKGITMAVISGRERLVRKDLVFGEVWIATGQSNMRWMLKDCESGEEEIEGGGDAKIRVLNFQGRLHPDGSRFPRDFLSQIDESNYYETEGWQRASPTSLAEFSGVG
ncbi:MAG: hypothetical protein ACPGQF_09465, partial [Akkermansiaceae bacterium]